MEKRKIVAGYALWTFINLLLLIWGIVGRAKWSNSYYNYENPSERFFPFDSTGFTRYDLTEFIVYVIAPIFLYYLYRYVKGEK